MEFLKSVGKAKTPPVLPKHLSRFWTAFCSMQARRQFSESGPQPVGYQDIANYLDLEGGWVSHRQRGRFTRIICALDDEYLRYSNEKRIAAQRAARGNR